MTLDNSQLERDIERDEAWLRGHSDPQIPAELSAGIKRAGRRELQAARLQGRPRRGGWLLAATGAAAAVLLLVVARRPVDTASPQTAGDIQIAAPSHADPSIALPIPDWPDGSLFASADGWDDELAELEQWHDADDWSLGGDSLYDVFESVMN